MQNGQPTKRFEPLQRLRARDRSVKTSLSRTVIYYGSFQVGTSAAVSTVTSISGVLVRVNRIYH